MKAHDEEPDVDKIALRQAYSSILQQIDIMFCNVELILFCCTGMSSELPSEA